MREKERNEKGKRREAKGGEEEGEKERNIKKGGGRGLT